MAIDKTNCSGDKTITFKDEKVFQESREKAELVLIKRYRSPSMPDPKNPGKEITNPLYEGCGECPTGKGQCHGTVIFDKEGWTEPKDWDTIVDSAGKLTAGKHFTFSGNMKITCKCVANGKPK